LDVNGIPAAIDFSRAFARKRPWCWRKNMLLRHFPAVNHGGY
jgi:hypothetical protein